MPYGASREGTGCARCLRGHSQFGGEEVGAWGFLLGVWGFENNQLRGVCFFKSDAFVCSRDLVDPLIELGIERPLRMILEQV